MYHLRRPRRGLSLHHRPHTHTQLAHPPWVGDGLRQHLRHFTVSRYRRVSDYRRVANVVFAETNHHTSSVKTMETRRSMKRCLYKSCVDELSSLVRWYSIRVGAQYSQYSMSVLTLVIPNLRIGLLECHGTTWMIVNHFQPHLRYRIALGLLLSLSCCTFWSIPTVDLSPNARWWDGDNWHCWGRRRYQRRPKR